jgi:hypothetical protein
VLPASDFWKGSVNDQEEANIFGAVTAISYGENLAPPEAVPDSDKKTIAKRREAQSGAIYGAISASIIASIKQKGLKDRPQE